MYKKFFMAAVLILFATTTLFPQDSNLEEKNNNSPFNLNWTLEGILFTSSIGLIGTVHYLDKVAEVNHLELNEFSLDPSQINDFDKMIMNPYSETIDNMGTVIGIFSILTPAILLSAPTDQWLTIGAMYAETILLAYGIKEWGKLCINRPRPYMYYEGFPQDSENSNDWNKSFPSGHTTLAFAGASFTSFVFCKYFPDSKWQIPVIASSYAFAVGTAVCRIAGGNHFLTDVMAGAVLGTACGFFIPWLHSLNLDIRPIESTKDLSLQISPSGAILTINY